MKQIQVLRLLFGAALFALVACGGSGLPPAGPKPGDVDDGFGTTRPADKSTGAVSTVTDRPQAPLRLEDLLRGKAAGVQVITGPDGKQRLRIRGGNPTLTGQAEQDPLIIVDGIPIAQDALATALSGLTSDEIEQVDVLKDAASTAVYGTRGAAGVIVINTTRR